MNTIRDILLDNNIPTAGQGDKHGRVGWIQIDCPLCATVGKFHLGISLTTGAANCWKCGRKNTAQILAMITGKTAPVMRERLENIQYTAPKVRKTGRLALPKGRGELLPGHRRYLEGRGYNIATVESLWGAQGIGQAACLKWRVFIPIHHHGEIVSWTTRSIRENDEQRYISASEDAESISHKTILYGADYARHAIVIHEGPLDVWATGPGAVATCGTAYTEAQLKAMSKYAIRAVCFDNEPAAQRRAKDLANALSVYPGTTHNIQLETGKDTGEAELAEVEEIRERFLK